MKITLKNGEEVIYVGTEMSGDVYKHVSKRGITTFLIDVSNGMAPIDFHTCTGDYEPCSSVIDKWQPENEKLISDYGKLREV